MNTSIRMRAALAASAAAAIAAVLIAGPAPVLADPDPMLGGLFGQNESLLFRWGAGGAPGGTMKTAILAAVDDANSSRRAKAPVFTYDTAGGNTIYYGTDVPCGTNGLGCFRRTTTDDWFAVWLRENGHRFDWGTLRWCEPAGDPDGCYEAETITLDELGHVSGLDHHVNLANGSDYTDAVVQEYSHTKPLAGWNAHVYGRCDVAALQQAYDVLTTSTLYSTCLDVPSAMTLTASRSTVVSGSVVTFAATLKSAGTGKLSNNMVTGRTVVLQVRSGTSWSDAVTLAPTGAAGAYQGQLLMRATTEVRVIFRRPSNEGLRGSSSPMITVTVTAACTAVLCPQGPVPTGK